MNEAKIKLLVFTSYLGSGGAEKHVVRLLNHLDPTRFIIEVVVPDKEGSYENELNDNIVITKIGLPLGRLSATLMRLTCLLPLRRIIQQRKPDILFSVMDIHNLIAIEALRFVNVKPVLVLGVQNSITDLYSQSGWVGKRILSLIPQKYQKADQIIALSRGVATDLLKLAPSLEKKVKVIYNCGLDDILLRKLQELPIEVPEEARPLIIACGRLEHQKGFPHLIKAFAQVRQQIPAHLWIIGKGKERNTLEQLAITYKVSKFVRFLGFQSNPYKYFAAADVFVLSSLHEGFGNVIVEAMACGTSVISTDCPHGPNEIITHNLNGLLVETANELQLADAIIQVLTNKELKTNLAANGKIRANDFHASLIAKIHENLFLKFANHA